MILAALLFYESSEIMSTTDSKNFRCYINTLEIFTLFLVASTFGETHIWVFQQSHCPNSKHVGDQSMDDWVSDLDSTVPFKVPRSEKYRKILGLTSQEVVKASQALRERDWVNYPRRMGWGSIRLHFLAITQHLPTLVGCHWCEVERYEVLSDDICLAVCQMRRSVFYRIAPVFDPKL